MIGRLGNWTDDLGQLLQIVASVATVATDRTTNIIGVGLFSYIFLPPLFV